MLQNQHVATPSVLEPVNNGLYNIRLLSFKFRLNSIYALRLSGSFTVSGVDREHAKAIAMQDKVELQVGKLETTQVCHLTPR